MLKFVTDKSFDLEKTYEYILSIQVRLDGFSFSVVCPAENKLVAFKNTNFKTGSSTLIARRFKDWMNEEELLLKPFKRIRLIVFSDQYTILPEEYANNELKQKAPSILFENFEKLEIAENVISNINARLVFVLPNGLNTIVNETIGECEIVHPVKAIATNLPTLKNAFGLIIVLNKNSLYLTLFKQGEILLSNNFRISNINDAVYYALTVLKQLEIEPQNVDLFYSSDITQENVSIKTLKKFFTNPKSLINSNPVQIPNELQKYATYYNCFF